MVESSPDAAQTASIQSYPEDGTNLTSGWGIGRQEQKYELGSMNQELGDFALMWMGEWDREETTNGQGWTGMERERVGEMLHESGKRCSEQEKRRER